MLPRGFARGLLNYQEKIDKQREKLQEKIDSRMEKIQTLLATRGASSSKQKLYTGDSIIVKNKIGNAEGSNLIYKAIGEDPAFAMEYAKAIRKAEERLNGPLSPEQAVDLFTVVKLGGNEQLEGYIETNDIYEALKKADLGKDDEFYRLLRGASTPRVTPKYSVVQKDFIPKVEPEVTKRQTEFFNQKLLELAETRKQQVKGTEEAKVIQKEINMARQGSKDYSGLRNRFGLDVVSGLDTGIPMFRTAYTNNPTIAPIARRKQAIDTLPEDVIQTLISNPSDDMKRKFEEMVRKKLNIDPSGVVDYILRTYR